MSHRTIASDIFSPDFGGKVSASVGQIKSAAWAKFTETVWKFCYVCID